MAESKHYVLDNQQPYPEPQEERWIWWMKNDNPPLAVTEVGDVQIRTTFQGYDFSPTASRNGDEPQLFLTRLVGGDSNGLEKYSATWTEAMDRHSRVVERLQERLIKRARQPQPVAAKPMPMQMPGVLPVAGQPARQSVFDVPESILTSPQFEKYRQSLRDAQRLGATSHDSAITVTGKWF